MLKLIITASDELYETLSAKTRTEGLVPRRAHDVLQGFELAMRLGKSRADHGSGDTELADKLSSIVVDMSLHAADTLIETLYSRPVTSGIPLVAVKCDGQAIPLALRRLCADILKMDGSAPLKEQTMDRL